MTCRVQAGPPESHPAAAADLAAQGFCRRGFMYYVFDGGQGETNVAQLTLSYDGDTPIMVQAHGVGPVDAFFKCLQQYARVRGLPIDGLELVGPFRIESCGEGSEALAKVKLRLTLGSHPVDGHASRKNIVIASLDALIDAFNRLYRPGALSADTPATAALFGENAEFIGCGSE